MSWIDDLWSWATDAAETAWDVGKNVASTAWDVAKENPLATAGVIHGATSGGDFGQRAGEALKWGGLGYAADKALGSNQWFSDQGSSYGSGAVGLQTPSTSVNAPTATTSNIPGVGATAVAPGVTVTTPSAVAAPAGGGDFGLRTETLQAAGVGDLPSRATNPNFYDRIPTVSNGGLSTGASTVGVSNAGGVPVLDKINAGLQTIRDTSKQYGDVVGLGIKGFSAYQGMEQGRKADEYMREQARLRDEAMGQNRAIVDKQNALTQQRADEYLAIDPQREAAKAYSDVMGRQSRAANQLEETELNKGYSAATAAANKRRAMLGAATGASTAAEAARAQREGTRMAGLSGIRYSTQATPSFDSTYYSAIANAGRGETEGAVKFLDDLTGLQTTKAKEQVQQNKVPQ